MKEELEMMLKFIESDEYKQAQEIAKKSITEMVEMQDKAKKLDQVEQIILDYTSSSGCIKIEDVLDAILTLFIVSIDTSDSRIKEGQE